MIKYLRTDSYIAKGNICEIIHLFLRGFRYRDAVMFGWRLAKKVKKVPPEDER